MKKLNNNTIYQLIHHDIIGVRQRNFNYLQNPYGNINKLAHNTVFDVAQPTWYFCMRAYLEGLMYWGVMEMRVVEVIENTH